MIGLQETTFDTVGNPERIQKPQYEQGDTTSVKDESSSKLQELPGTVQYLNKEDTQAKIGKFLLNYVNKGANVTINCANDTNKFPYNTILCFNP